LKIKQKFFFRLRNRGYKNVFLAKLFKKVKYGTRNKLLAISADNENYRETGNNRSDTILINEAERMFQLTFSEEKIPVEIIKTTMSVLVVSFLPILCVVSQRLVAKTTIVCTKKGDMKKNNLFVFLCLSFMLVFQETDLSKQH